MQAEQKNKQDADIPMKQSELSDKKPKDSDERNKLKIGSKCEIYSDSKKKWAEGQVIKITTDDEGEWLTIKYEIDSVLKQKEIQRYNEYIRINKRKSNEKEETDEKEEKKLNDQDNEDMQICFIEQPVINNTSVNFKTYRYEKWFETKNRMQFINITNQIEQLLLKSGIMDGILLVSPMHITASVLVQKDDKELHSDFGMYLETLVPNDETMSAGLYNHNSWGDANGDSHIKRQIFKREIWVSITNGKFDFGPNEQIIYAEFDGRRRKRVLIKIFGY